MRKRSIDQNFWKDPPTVGPWGRLLFAGLWCIADKRGVLEDNARMIKAEIFPHDQVDIDAELLALADRGYIVRFEVDGVRLIWIVNFVKYQSPSHREQAPKLPPPPTPTRRKGDRPLTETPEPPTGDSSLSIAGNCTQLPETSGNYLQPPATAGHCEQLQPVYGSVSGSVSGSGSVSVSGTATAVAADRTRGPLPFPPQGERGAPATDPGPSTPKCIRAGCTGELRRETGRWRETSTGGVGWFCQRTEGGCGTVYPRDEPAIVAQLSPRARAALEAEIQREVAGREAAAEAAMTPQTRALRSLVGELRAQQRTPPGEPPGRNAAIAGTVWLMVLEKLKPLVPVQSFATWLRAPVAIGILTDGEGDRLVVHVPSPQAREWLSKNYRNQITQAFRDIGRMDLGLVYVTADEVAAAPPVDRANGPPAEASA